MPYNRVLARVVQRERERGRGRERERERERERCREKVDLTKIIYYHGQRN
jgi:hypothetical protein